MSPESRRTFLLRATGAGSLVALGGCTAFGTVEADVFVENTGPDEERTEDYIDRGGTTETKTVELPPGEKHTASVQVARGDVAVVSKGELRVEPTFDELVRRAPTLYVDTGFGAIGASWRCERRATLLASGAGGYRPPSIRHPAQTRVSLRGSRRSRSPLD